MGTTSSPAPVGRHAVHDAVLGLFGRLDARGIDWLVLRGWDDLRRPAGDIDILVHPAAEATIDGIVAESAFVPMRARGHGTHRFHVLYDDVADLWLKLDIVTVVEFGRYQEVRTTLGGPMLARRRRLGPVAVPAPDDALWHLVVHHVLDGGDVPPRRRAAVRSLALERGEPGPVAAFVDEARPGTTVLLSAAFRHDDWGAAHALERELRTALRRRAGVRSAARAARTRAERHLPPPGPATGL